MQQDPLATARLHKASPEHPLPGIDFTYNQHVSRRALVAGLCVQAICSISDGEDQPQLANVSRTILHLDRDSWELLDTCQPHG